MSTHTKYLLHCIDKTNMTNSNLLAVLLCFLWVILSLTAPVTHTASTNLAVRSITQCTRQLSNPICGFNISISDSSEAQFVVEFDPQQQLYLTKTNKEINPTRAIKEIIIETFCHPTGNANLSQPIFDPKTKCMVKVVLVQHSVDISIKYYMSTMITKYT